MQDRFAQLVAQNRREARDDFGRDAGGHAGGVFDVTVCDQGRECAPVAQAGGFFNREPFCDALGFGQLVVFADSIGLGLRLLPFGLAFKPTTRRAATSAPSAWRTSAGASLTCAPTSATVPPPNSCRALRTRARSRSGVRAASSKIVLMQE